MKISLFGNVYQTKKNKYVYAVLETLCRLGIEVSVEKRFAAFIHSGLGIDLCRVNISEGSAPDADMVISMGGDGTFLTTASGVGPLEIPILGINTGRLGFLADVSPGDIETALAAVVRGDYVVEPRTLISVTKDGAPLTGYPYALNEVAVLKHDNSSLIAIETHVDGFHLNTYMADGLVVSTPTGSTGYSLSVGGPVIVPGSDIFCISPVASHSLNTRPVVIRDNAEITLRVRSRSHNFLISIDGRSESFADTTTLRLTRAPYKVGVVKVMHKNCFDTLREKMLWGIDSRG